MPDLVTVFHPETGLTAEQPRSALGQLYLAGWRLVTETPPPLAPDDPEPMSRAEVEQARQQLGAQVAELDAQGQPLQTQATPGDGRDRVDPGSSGTGPPTTIPPAAAPAEGASVQSGTQSSEEK